MIEFMTQRKDSSSRPKMVSHDRDCHSRTAHILIRLAELGTIVASRTTFLDNVLDDFL